MKLKQNSSYFLCELNSVPYLLPFGQSVADLRRGVRLNETGKYIWDLTENEITEQEILSRCASHFQADSAELPQLEKDIRQFLDQLRSRGVLEEHASFPLPAAEGMYLSIGGLILKLVGMTSYISEEFTRFALAPGTCPKTPDQTVEIRPFPPVPRPLGRTLLRNQELLVLEGSEGYVLVFPAAVSPLEALVSPDGSQVILSAAGTPTETFVSDIFHAIRLCFLYLAQRRGLFALHSASFLYRDRIWLFSGHSGAGKSTHTNLWKELLQVTPVNGDLNLLDINGERPLVHGLPWCGTSEISSPGTWPLGGITFLKQAPCNRVEQLACEEKQLLVSQHMISPAWTREQTLLNLSAAEKLCSRILVCRLHCTKEPEAVETMRAAVDSWLDDSHGAACS